MGMSLIESISSPSSNPNNSAGLAAIVAYSLITAIHYVKDESSPLVLDAAFERIDQKRQQKIVSQLPDVSKQLLILGLEKDIGESIFTRENAR